MTLSPVLMFERLRLCDFLDGPLVVCELLDRLPFRKKGRSNTAANLAYFADQYPPFLPIWKKLALGAHPLILLIRRRHRPEFPKWPHPTVFPGSRLECP